MSIWIITNAITAWLLPPGLLVLLMAWGLLRMGKHPRSGKTMVTLAVLSLWALSMPWMGRTLMGMLESVTDDPVRAAPAQAIVVLGGGKYPAPPEFGGTDTVGAASLVRLRYAAYLYRATGKPLLVSGGSPEGGKISEAYAMKSVLENEFKVPVTWTENASANTHENARASFAVLKAQGITRIYLVTHAWHMPRSQRSFVEAGFTVVPAPTAFTTSFGFTVLDCLPNAGSLRQSSQFFHELIGLAWYRLKSALH
jgi:uncharacterized SAM-binding protein YcdF (DUF218 family)